MKTSRSWIQIALPLFVVAFMALMVLFGVTRSLVLTVLDVYTHFVPSPKERPEIVLIDADDGAIQNVGQWPWGRTCMPATWPT